jgi:hypothetical protein
MKLFIITALLILSACSVYKASDMQGATVEDITRCDKKECFLGLGSQVLDTKNNPDGTTDVVYKVKRKNGNVGRAITYGVADVLTLGIWEAVGTPLEGYVSDNDSIVYKVTYARDGGVNKVTIQDK